MFDRDRVLEKQSHFTPELQGSRRAFSIKKVSVKIISKVILFVMLNLYFLIIVSFTVLLMRIILNTRREMKNQVCLDTYTINDILTS